MVVKIGNDKVHCLEFGKAKPLVLVPSLWVTSRSYKRLGQALGKYYHVYIPDIYRGKSVFSGIATNLDDYVDKLNKVILTLNVRDFYLVGVSFSGITTTQFVLLHANRPKKMLLVSSTVLPLNIQNPRITLLWGYVMLLFHNMFSLEGLKINWLWITDGVSNARRHFGQVWQEGLIATSLTIRNITSLPVPTKILFALRDEFIPRELVKRLKRVKNLHVETIDGYHGWFFGREETLTHKIRVFFSPI